MTHWNFDADYFTTCNCEWGCPCNFNARPNEGRCMGWGAWQIRAGRFGSVVLDDTRFALYYKFPGPIEQGQGSACAYVDANADPTQREALATIASGQAGGGIFELFGAQLVTRWLPTRFVPILFELSETEVRVRIEGYGEGESELLTYPDGTLIKPWLELPHGIEYKRGLMTNARRWWWRDEDLLASYSDRYGAVARVRFSEQGCIA